LAAGCAAAALAVSIEAFAQGTLPPLSVETATQKKKAKAAPKKAAAPEAEPAPEPKAEPGDKARSEAVYKTPAGISIATKSDIETFGKADVGDILRAMPGVTMRESPQNAGLAINIRGFEGSGRVTMMIDGVRQSFKFTGHEAQGFTFVDPALLAGIDIQRGAVSTVGGAGALTGAANLRTIDVEDILKPGLKMGALSSIMYGTNGIGGQEMLAGAMTSEGVSVAAAFSHSDPDNFKNGAGVTVPFTSQDLNSGLFKLNFALTSEQSLKLGAVLYDNDFFANSNFQNVKSETYTAKYAYRPFGNPLIDFTLNAHANRVRMEYFSGSAAGRVVDDDGWGFDVTNTSNLSLGAVKVAATYGYEYFTDDVSSFNKTTPGSGGGVNPSGQSTIAGAFSQFKFSHGVVDLITGLRYDTYTLQGTIPNFPTIGQSYQLDIDEGRLNPKITLAAKVLPWLQPYVTYAETFRAPTIFETMLGGTHPSAGTNPFGFKPNPFLEPEVSKGWEFGFNMVKDSLFKPGDAFRFRVAYFDMNVENYIVGDLGSFTFINVPGISEISGVEVEGKYDAGFYFGSLAYTYTHSDLPSQLAGLGAPQTPPEHVAVLTAGLRLLDQKLTVGARVSYFSETDIGAINVGPPPAQYASQFMPGYTLVDLFSSYKFDSGLEIGFTAANIFDVEYTPALSTPFNASGVCFGGNAVNCNDTGRGRTLLLSAKMKF
jgi:hemoglobin/transferrin/lactoferrin receptor protein